MSRNVTRTGDLMPLHPQAEAMLAMMAQMPAVDYQRVSAPELRAMMDGASMFAPGDEVGDVRALSIDGPAGLLPLRLYTPADAEASTLPVTLYFHGGGFVLGTLDTHDNICRCICARAGCAVLAVDYRRAPEAPFPAAPEDAWAAWQWLRAAAASMGLDPERIAVAGDSAGGNLAAGVAARASAAGAPPSHELLLYPVVDATEEEWAAPGAFLTPEMMRWFLRCYLHHPGDAQHPLASPLRHVDDAAGRRLTVVTAEYDILRDSGEAYAQAMREAGAQVELRRWPGQVHGFASMLGALDDASAALDFAALRLRQAFAAANVATP
jgi:acetyl esterase